MRPAFFPGKVHACKRWPSSIQHRRTTSVSVRGQAVASSISLKPSTLKWLGYRTDFADRFYVAEQLGAGSFGVVHVAVDKVTGERYAVKTVPKRFVGGYLEANFVERVQREVDIYTHLGQSLNVAHLYDAFEDDTCVDMLLQLCTGGELWKKIRRGHYDEAQAARLVRDVLRAVAQCHAKGIVIRDVKPENFLFLNDQDDSPLKMIDFGIATYCQPGEVLTSRAGTPVYLSPELVRQHYSLPTDLWSTGVLAYQLLLARLPFSDPDASDASESYMSKQVFSNKELFRAVLYAPLRFCGPEWAQLSPEAQDLLARLLDRDAGRRPTAEQALQHPWFDQLEQQPSSSSSGSKPLSDTLVQRLQRFGTYGKLKRAALGALATRAAEDVDVMQQLRATMASGGSRKIPYSDVAQLLRSGAYSLSDEEVKQLLLQFEVDADGCVDYYQWLAALMDWQEVQQSARWEEWVGGVFDAFAEDGSGRIGRSALTHLLCGELCAVEDTVAAALREYDLDHDGGISFEEFAGLLAQGRSDRLELFDSRRVERLAA